MTKMPSDPNVYLAAFLILALFFIILSIIFPLSKAFLENLKRSKERVKEANNKKILFEVASNFRIPSKITWSKVKFDQTNKSN